MAFWGYVIVSAITFALSVIDFRGRSTSAVFYRTSFIDSPFWDLERWETERRNRKRHQQGSFLRGLVFLCLWGIGAWVFYRYFTSFWAILIGLMFGYPGGVTLTFAWGNLVGYFYRYR